MKKVYSVRRGLIRYFSLLLVTTILLMAGIGIYARWAYDQQLRYCSETAMELYRSSLTSSTEKLRESAERFTAESSDFRLRCSSRLHEEDRLRLEHRLKAVMDGAVPESGLLLMCDDAGWLQYSLGRKLLHQGFLTGELQKAAHALRDAGLAMQESQLTRWQIFRWGKYVFLLNVYAYRNQRVCAALELNAFAETSASAGDGISLLFHQNGEYLNGNGMKAEDLPDLSAGFRPGSIFTGYATAGTRLETLGIGMICRMPMKGIWQYSRVFIPVLILLTALCIMVFLNMYRMMDHVVAYPLQQVSALSQRLMTVRETEIPQLQEKEKLEELNVLRESLNGLAAQKIRLQKQSDDQETEKEHAQLQYFQLQTRSHFFLNCLKSLYGMLETGDGERMKEMIIAFSNHLRFVFHDNLSLVPLQAELEEVRDYHRIISMDSRQPVLLTQEISEGAEKCLVPPLILQTFLENSYKYNGRGRELLQFTIRIDRMNYEGRDRLRIRLSDDGIGYPEETLKILNGQTEPETYNQYHVGINNLRRRMAILYEDDFELAFFNGYPRGANILISLPAREEGGESQ